MNETNFNLTRYSIIEHKNPREIVLLKGLGCQWQSCCFCDYHLDSDPNGVKNYLLNRKELEKVTGKYQRLEVINSGSFCELDDSTISYIERICQKKNIKHLYFECHWIYRDEIQDYRQYFLQRGVMVHIKSGVETFDIPFREKVLKKGFEESSPEVIARYFDEICLLQGLKGQTIESMKQDIETGLQYFDRICINIMVENSMPLKPDPEVIEWFQIFIYPLYAANERVDILVENTDFGIGGMKKNEYQ